MARTRQLPPLLSTLRSRYPHLPLHYDRNAETKSTKNDWKQKIQKKQYIPKPTLSKAGLVILYTAVESYGADAVRQTVLSDTERYKVFVEAKTGQKKQKPTATITTTKKTTTDRVIGFVAGSEKDITLSEIKKEFRTLDRFYQAIRNSSSLNTLDRLPVRPPKMTFKGILQVVDGLSHSQTLFRVSGPHHAFYLERSSSTV